MAATAAAPYAQVMEDMAKGQEYATQLQVLLRESRSPEAGRLVDQILHAMSRTIQTAKAAAAAEEASEVQSDVTYAGTGAGGGSGKRKAAAGGGADKRPACRKRSQGSLVETTNTKNLDDGHAWRKYGQKEIQNSKYPKAYFRCTHKFDQQCLAQRQVQRRDDDPEVYMVTYIGEHTCRDPATITPLVVHAHDVTVAAGELHHHAGSRLISFAATTASTTTTGNTSSQQKDAAAAAAAAALLAGRGPLKKLKLEAGGGEQEQEEVLSSLTPAGSSQAMRNATATTPGADQGDVTSGLQLQQLWYGGDHLAGSARFDYDDDTFDLEDILFSGSITDIYDAGY